MNRRNLLKSSVALGFASAIPTLASGKPFAGPAQTPSAKDHPSAPSNPLVAPASGDVPVAFVISDGAVVIDFCGPWEVFQDSGFHLYTVAESVQPIKASGGLQIVPNYTFESAPAPKVIVIPAQRGATEAMLQWIRNATKTTDVTMSVCTGAFVLAKTGLLAGKSATTFHGAFDSFEKQFPDVHLKRGARFVEDGNLATAGGLSSGIDLAMRVVERYSNRETAEKVAFTLEYQGQGWKNAESNVIYAKYVNPAPAIAGAPICPVCGMAGLPVIASVYKGKTYNFCSRDDKQTFDESPEKFVKSA